MELKIIEAFNQMDPLIYKIISKALANRLKTTLPLCISQNQSAFVLGHMIHENILIAHELMHYLQSLKNGPNKGFVIKLDMSKAYDRVEWNFLEDVMKSLGFVEA
ncbi:reverse transcriptase [Gossypium australe]|uniref:Reverse transcriptase n=1 Tax=Gossypium australe TaxID=47621 RepID=A0A5B6VM35_9ROSI|nr:reverse transcriptase [Gossypium australe]